MTQLISKIFFFDVDLVEKRNIVFAAWGGGKALL